MGVKFTFDTKKNNEGIRKKYKKESLIEVKCPKCENIVGKYSYDYLKQKGELFCDICNDNFIVNITFKNK